MSHGFAKPWQTWREPEPISKPKTDSEISEPKNGDSQHVKRQRLPSIDSCYVQILRRSYSNSSTKGEEDNLGLRFSPSVCSQRYLAVLSQFQQNPSIRKVVDVGSSDLRFAERLIRRSYSHQITDLIAMDVDLSLLIENCHKLTPLTGDYLARRCFSMNVSVLGGSIFDFDPRIADADCVTMIEVIEHLQPEDIPKMEATIFERVRPFMAIFTTPNAEFNPAFEMPPGKFRHWDHKFEWTRAEFKTWADAVVEKYPEYTYEYDGIGAGPPSTAELGFVSQMIVFRRNGKNADLDREMRLQTALETQELKYKEIVSSVYLSEDVYVRKAQAIRRTVESMCYRAIGETERELDPGEEVTCPVSYFMQNESIQRRCKNEDELLTYLWYDLPFSEGGQCVKFWFDVHGNFTFTVPTPPPSAIESEDQDDEEYDHGDVNFVGATIGEEGELIGTIEKEGDLTATIEQEGETG